MGGKKPSSQGNDKKKPKEPAKTAPKKTCIFVEYTHQGALAKKLREVAQRLEHILGFGIKVPEGEQGDQKIFWIFRDLKVF